MDDERVWEAAGGKTGISGGHQRPVGRDCQAAMGRYMMSQHCPSISWPSVPSTGVLVCVYESGLCCAVEGDTGVWLKHLSEDAAGGMAWSPEVAFAGKLLPYPP